MMSKWIIVLQGLVMILQVGIATLGFLRPFPGFTWFVIGGLILQVVGFSFFFLGAVTLRRNFTPLVTPKSQLITNGIYRYSRNPVYLGGLIATAGWTLYLLSPMLFIATATLGVILHYK